MSTLIQIRNVPTEVHRTAKARAALAGMTLSEYALRALQREVEKPTMKEVAARVRLLPPIESKGWTVDLIREERETR